MALFDKKFESAKQEWETPDNLYLPIHTEFGFELDLAADDSNKKCERYFDSRIDGLSQEWNGICWLNPPYGEKQKTIADWVRKSFRESQDGSCTVVMLIPARTNTRWWHEYCMKAAEIRFIKGRPKFGGATHGSSSTASSCCFQEARREYEVLYAGGVLMSVSLQDATALMKDVEECIAAEAKNGFTVAYAQIPLDYYSALLPMLVNRESLTPLGEWDSRAGVIRVYGERYYPFRARVLFHAHDDGLAFSSRTRAMLKTIGDQEWVEQ